jgi:hypothetical protein
MSRVGGEEKGMEAKDGERRCEEKGAEDVGREREGLEKTDGETQRERRTGVGKGDRRRVE